MTTWTRITEGIGLALGGDEVRGRAVMLTCWAGTGAGDHAQRCVLAHYLADTEPSVDDEVSWDEQALAAFQHLGSGDLAAIGILDASGLAPSLHLNLGDGYRRQGRPEEARLQVEAGRAAVAVLPQDGYGGLIRGGLDRLADRLRPATGQ